MRDQLTWFAPAKRWRYQGDLLLSEAEVQRLEQWQRDGAGSLAGTKTHGDAWGTWPKQQALNLTSSVDDELDPTSNS